MNFDSKISTKVIRSKTMFIKYLNNKIYFFVRYLYISRFFSNVVFELFGIFIRVAWRLANRSFALLSTKDSFFNEVKSFNRIN